MKKYTICNLFFRNVWCNKNVAFPIANSKSYRPQESDNRILHLDIYDHSVRTKNAILCIVLIFFFVESWSYISNLLKFYK